MWYNLFDKFAKLLKKCHLFVKIERTNFRLEDRWGIKSMNNDERTMRFDANKNESNKVSNMLNTVYNALEEKEYNPINQIVGYLLSGDPAYIPRHNDARNLIRRFERDEVLEEILKEYLERNEK